MGESPIIADDFSFSLERLRLLDVNDTGRLICYISLGQVRETRLYSCGRQYHAPWLDRWSSPDPLGTAEGLNSHRYCGNDPVKGEKFMGEVLSGGATVAASTGDDPWMAGWQIQGSFLQRAMATKEKKGTRTNSRSISTGQKPGRKIHRSESRRSCPMGIRPFGQEKHWNGMGDLEKTGFELA